MAAVAVCAAVAPALLAASGPAAQASVRLSPAPVHGEKGLMKVLVSRPGLRIVRIMAPDDIGSCTVENATTYFAGIITATTYMTDCTEAGICLQLADLQQLDSSMPKFGWGTIDSGVTTEGCSYANRSVASASCKTVTTKWSYRTLGIVTILWDDGDQSGPEDTYNNGLLDTKYLCS